MRLYNRKGLSIVILLAALTSALFARNIQWETKDKPPVSIIAAVEAATKELDKGGADFYCLGGSIGRNFSECDWLLTFSNATGEVRWVSVGSDGKIRVSKEAFEYD